MLVKTLGAALILGSTTWTGWQVAARYASRPRDLRDLQTALAVLQTEVEYGATPLPEALDAAAKAGGIRVGPIFSAAARSLEKGGGVSGGDAWRAALERWTDPTALNQQDQDILMALGSVLGSTGRQDQVRHLQLAQQRLGGQEARAIDERSRYERAARYLGVLSGAALVLILI